MNTQSIALKIIKKTIKTASKKYKELPEERFWVQENRIENKSYWNLMIWRFHYLYTTPVLIY